MAGKKGRSGRPKGSRNTDKRSLLAFIQERFPNYDPILSMAERANNRELSEEIRFKSDEQILKYTYSPMRASDPTFDEDKRPVIIIKQYGNQADTEEIEE